MLGTRTLSMSATGRRTVGGSARSDAVVISEKDLAATRELTQVATVMQMGRTTVDAGRVTKAEAHRAALDRRARYAAVDTARLRTRIATQDYTEEELHTYAKHERVPAATLNALSRLVLSASSAAGQRKLLQTKVARMGAEAAEEALEAREAAARRRSEEARDEARRARSAVERQAYADTLRSTMAQRERAREIEAEEREAEAARMIAHAEDVRRAEEAARAERQRAVRASAAAIAVANARVVARAREEAARDAAADRAAELYAAERAAREEREQRAKDLARLAEDRRRSRIMQTRVREMNEKAGEEEARTQRVIEARIMADRAAQAREVETRQQRLREQRDNFAAQIAAKAAQREAEIETERAEAAAFREEARAQALRDAAALHHRRAQAQVVKMELTRQIEGKRQSASEAKSMPLADRLAVDISQAALVRLKEAARTATLQQLQAMHAPAKLVHAAATMHL